MGYQAGDAATVNFTVTVNGTPTDSAPTPTITVTKPDGTAGSAGTVTHTGTGTYSAVVNLPSAGLWRYIWTSVAPQVVADGVLSVDITPKPSLISLADAKAQISDTETAHDSILQGYIDAASVMIQNHPDWGTGPIVPTVYTEVHNGGDPTIYVRHAPILTVTSLVEYYGSQSWTLSLQPLGSSVDAYGYSIDDARSGRIVRRSISGYVYQFPPGVGNVVVTYTAGLTSVSADVRLATLLLVQHMWETQQGGRTKGNRPQNNPAAMVTFPNRVIEALQGAKRGPAFA